MMKKSILIIDDEEKIRKLYKRLFQSTGLSVFEIIETSNATEATDYLIRQRVDLIILDINLPQISGEIMFEVIREYSDEIKVIVASVYPIEKQKRMIPFASDYYDKSNGLLKLLGKVSDNLS